MKHAIAIVAFLVLAIGTRADGVTLVNVSAVDCPACVGNPFEPLPVLPPMDLEVQLDVELVTGTFLYPAQDILETITVDEVMSLTGTYNGTPVTLAAPYEGDGGWFDPLNFGLGEVCFTSGQGETCAGNDAGLDLLVTERRLLGMQDLRRSLARWRCASSDCLQSLPDSLREGSP